ALLVKPGNRLKNADCGRVVLGGQTQGVADMIEVRVGDEQGVDLCRFFEPGWTGRILLEKWIDDPVFAALRFDRKASVPTEGNFVSSEIHEAVLRPANCGATGSSSKCLSACCVSSRTKGSDSVASRSWSARCASRPPSSPRAHAA